LGQDRFAAIARNYQNGISLYNQKEVGEIAIYLGSQASLSRIRERDEDLADFLQYLDAKLSRILAEVSKGPSPFDILQAQEVTLSGTGLAFSSKDQFAVGDLLELHLVLLPEFLYIYAIAKAVSSEKIPAAEPGFNFQVACEFALIMEEDREALIRHLFKRQHLALRNQRMPEQEDTP